jgi:hypothetical protein
LTAFGLNDINNGINFLTKGIMPRKKLEDSLDARMEQILREASSHPVTIRRIYQILAGRGYAALLCLFSLPFCLPITIPGLSTPFGFLLAFLGLRLAFGQRPWWPKWILSKEVSYATLKSIFDKMQWALSKLERVLHPRLSILVEHPIAHRVHGLLIFVLSLLLSIPFPVPFTNTFSALPIFCLGLGLLEDDGQFVIIAYALSLLSFIFFGFLFWFGGASLHRITAFI